jgi:5-methylcytosine-specific restriction protein A
VRASHIKPWASCTNGTERVDGNNGLLLTPTADHLFDRGWISFDEDGRLLRSTDLSGEIAGRIGLNLKHGRPCGRFRAQQQQYLEHHRAHVFERNYATHAEPFVSLLKAITEA